MRSAAEHLNPLRDKLGDYPASEHENLIAVRTYQAELLAGHVYRRVFTDQTILDFFREDSLISELWEKPDDELMKLWDKTIDLHSKLEGRFFDYLTS